MQMGLDDEYVLAKAVIIFYLALCPEGFETKMIA